MSNSILVISEDSNLIASLNRTLETNYRVLESPDIAKGKEKIDNEKVEMAIIDVRISYESESRVYAEYIKDLVRQNVIVYILIGEKETREMADLIEIADEFSVKPFTPDNLLSNVKSLLHLKEVEGKVLEQYEKLSLLDEEIPSKREKINDELKQIECLWDFVMEMKEKISRKNTELEENYVRIKEQSEALRREITERKRTEEALKEQSFLGALGADIGFALIQPGTLRDILQNCAESLVRNLNVAFARIWTFNSKENVLELQSSAGLYTHIDGPHSRVPVGKLKIGLIAQERKPHLTNSVIGDPRVNDQEWAKKMGMIAFAGYPLIIEDRLVGVMAMFAQKPLSEIILKALGSVSNSIALGIEHKRMENQLRKLSSTVEQSSTTIVITDTSGTIQYVNPKFTQLTGYTAEEAIGQNPRILKSGKTPPEVYKQLWDAITAGGEWQGEFCNKKKNGELYWELAHISPLRNSEGVITNFIAFKDDITEHKRIESEQEKLREQLFHNQNLASVGKLAGGIAHNFNNLLTVIMGYASILKTEMKKDDTFGEYAQKILNASQIAVHLVQGLLAFSRKQPANPQPIDLNGIIRETESLLLKLIREDIRLKTVLTEKDCIVMADVGQLEQVLMNIATNARDAMPGGGNLTISTDIFDMNDAFIKTHGYGKTGRYVLMSFSDTGVGMDENTRMRIFEPFFTTKEVGKGTGLGLASVYGIVKQYQGYIDVDSAPGKGATFRIYLPFIESKVYGKRTDKEPMPKGGTETILIAEDEEDVRSLMKIVLERNGYQVIEAEDGEHAIDTFLQNKDTITLLVFDVVMPKKNGIETYEAIKKMKPDMKVLFMSGYGDDVISTSDIHKSGFTYITKPVSPMDLLKKVREVLDT